MFLHARLQIMKMALVHFHRNRVKGYLDHRLSFAPHHFIVFMRHRTTLQMGCSFRTIN